MKYLFSNATIFLDNKPVKLDFVVDNAYLKKAENVESKNEYKVFDLNGYFVFPGFTDVHVHLREPGFSYKEDIRSGTLAAAHGGYTAVCSMPNLNPIPDTLNHLEKQLNIIMKDALVSVYPYAAITKAQQGKSLSDMEDLAEYAIAFSDDGKGVQNGLLMEQAMIKAKKLNKMIVAHCEDNSLLNGGYIHDGEYARLNNHRGISSESEYLQIERDLKLAKKTGVKYHVCHISTKESVELIRKAKSEGVDVTCETAPHYLVLTDMDLQDNGRFKMNPPLRSKEDKDALIRGLQDGTIDMIATDHAPHSIEEKSKGLKDSLMGVVGLETAFPVLYTNLVKTNVITLERLIELLHYNPCKRFNLENSFRVGKKANFTVFDLNDSYKIDSSVFLSKGRSTPFEGNTVYGRCKLTVANGKIVWCDKEFSDV